MPTNHHEPRPAKHPGRGAWLWLVAALLVFGLLAALPAAWARPDQAPDYQTVPTLTPTPTSPGQGATATPTSRPGEPTNTPAPGGQPTDTPVPGAPTATPSPAPTQTPTVTGTLPTSTPPPSPIAAGQCWTVPTPGFQPARLDGIAFEASSDQSLVVPGQQVLLRLSVTNGGAEVLPNALICNPLDPALLAGTPAASQGQARLESQGLIAELGDLAAGATARVELSLTVPADQPLGTVIEDQAWLFFDGQRASTSLWTWALPPAWLPPTGA